MKQDVDCPGKGMMDLGNIILEEDHTLLMEAVVVAGESPKSVNVEKTRIQAASSAAAATDPNCGYPRGWPPHPSWWQLPSP